MFVSFNNVDNTTLSFYITKKTVGAPSVKTAYVSIPGADGDLDLTEYFGAVRYNNRIITLNCVATNRSLNTYSNILKELHGKKKQIRFADDPGFYYVGRISINQWTHQKALGEFTLTITAEPYKYKETVTTVTTANNKSVTLNNLSRPVVPEITLNGATTITFGDFTISLSAGTYELPDIELKEGVNVITLAGTGNVTFNYQEGTL